MQVSCCSSSSSNSIKSNSRSQRPTLKPSTSSTPSVSQMVGWARGELRVWGRRKRDSFLSLTTGFARVCGGTRLWGRVTSWHLLMTGNGHKAGKEIADMARGKWVFWGLEAGPGESFSHQTGLEKLLLFFPETLAIVSDTGEPQGELTIEVQKGKYRDEQGILTHCLLVHACSRGFIDKSPCGSSLLGRVQLPCTTSSLHSPPPAALDLHGHQGKTWQGGRARLTLLSFSHGHIAPVWASLP